jgi:hypothetical protein
VARVVTIPAASDLLCEGCGYVLNGLPADARCPECGKPAAESAPDLRQPPSWEQPGPARGSLLRFMDTTAAVLFRPSRFFRALPPHAETNRSSNFARIHDGLSSLMLGVAALAHFDWFITLGGSRQFQIARQLPLLLLSWAAAYVMLRLTIRLAAALTTWEAGYRGYRLPLPVVRRGLHYHSAHYLPVGFVAVATVLGYQFLLARYELSPYSATTYLYVLSGEVGFFAVYLFLTYWTAMRNLMYANR